MSLAGGLVFECDVDGTRRRDLNRDRIVRFLRKAPETRLSRSGPKAVRPLLTKAVGLLGAPIPDIGDSSPIA